MTGIRHSPPPLAQRECAASGAEFARRHARALAAGAADRLLSRGQGTGPPLSRALGKALRALALAPLARRLAASAEPARRELGALLEAALVLSLTLFGQLDPVFSHILW